MGKQITFGMILINAGMCVMWATQVDTFIVSNAVLMAALVAAMVVEGD